ncbi:MAG: chemotaxis response regulator protein-glutamate methylesterase [Phycisphaeraceae bacterium]
MIKVVVVDDSAFMRRAIAGMIEKDPDLEVIGTGKNGVEAIELAKSLKPDVMTLDIEMPEMDGLTALRVIMRECPTRVLMCSSLTTGGSIESLRALRIGAVDIIAKDHSTFSTKMGEMQDDLLARLKAIGRSRGHYIASPPAGATTGKPNPKAAPTPQAVNTSLKRVNDVSIVCIGSSTGGPPVLESIIEGLPENFPFPVVIAQHMPGIFTESMTKRLASSSKVSVIHGEPGTPITPGTVMILHGGDHHRIVGRPGSARIEHVDDDTQVYKPSVNILLESAAKVYGSHALGVVLTGIGRDGAEGAKKITAAGGTILAQDEATSVVYGMPKAVVEDGTAKAALPPDSLLNVLLESAQLATSKAA